MSTQRTPIEKAILGARRVSFLGLNWDAVVKYFFGGNAWVAIIILALITLFLFREGAGFVGQNVENLRTYRAAGLEYVDILRGQSEEFTNLSRQLNAIRLQQVKKMFADKIDLKEVNASLKPFDEFSSKFSEAGSPLYGLVSDLTDVASAAKGGPQDPEDTDEEGF